MTGRHFRPAEAGAPQLRTELVEMIRSAIGPLIVAFVALVALGLVLGFGIVGHHGTGPLQGFNHRVDGWFPNHRYHLAGVSVWIATIFDAPVLGPISVVIAAVLWFRLRSVRCLIPFIAYLGAEALVFILKKVVDEPRPMAHQVISDKSLAFPSGHATAGAAVAFALAGLATARRRSPWPWVAAALLALAVMASRLILGVHWFGDVTIGAVLGTAWGIAVVRYFQQPTRRALTDAVGAT